MPAPAWAEKYIGLPFMSRGQTSVGCDCWGLCRLISREQFGVILPDYEYQAAGDRKANGELVKVFASGSEWREIKWRNMSAGDILVIKVFSEPSHVGIVLDRNFFLSTREGTNAMLGRFHSPVYERRVDGIFRYIGA